MMYGTFQKTNLNHSIKKLINYSPTKSDDG